MVDPDKTHELSRYLLAPIRGMDFDDESFSLVAAKNVLEHTLNPDLALSEIHRVIANGGYLICMIPLDGDSIGVDNVALHPAFNYGNPLHVWKATFSGVLMRLANLGFTELQYEVHSHSQLFGTVNPTGERVIVVKAQKIKDIVKVPTQWLLGDAYWGAFLTLNCTGNCKYCIQYLSRDEFMNAKQDYAHEGLSSKQWVDFYNSIQKHKLQRLSVVGGEATLHDGFFDVVNGVKGYYKTVTTNLCAPCFEDIPNRFAASVQDEAKETLRINTSFHPKIISVDEFSSRVHQLKELGFVVDQIAMVDHPTSNFNYYYHEFIKKGLALNPQTFLGKFNNVLLPHPEFSISNDYREHGIDDYEKYTEGFSCETKSKVLCMTRRFLVAPNGSIFRCHYHLYSNRSPVGSVRSGTLPNPTDFVECVDYGYCNPCDYPHAKFRSMEIHLPNILMSLTKDQALTTSLLDDVNASPEDFKELVIEIAAELYHSNNPQWELYYNSNIKELLNAYILEGGHRDNSNSLLVAYFDGNLFRIVNGGVNIYRLLEEAALLK